jgi:hypothetical protein
MMLMLIFIDIPAITKRLMTGFLFCISKYIWGGIRLKNIEVGMKVKVKRRYFKEGELMPAVVVSVFPTYIVLQIKSFADCNYFETIHKFNIPSQFQENMVISL